jgi:hypothetical protein
MSAVTAMRFHPQRPDVFFSGSDDGLVAAFDFHLGINEDDAFRVCSYTALTQLSRA